MDYRSLTSLLLRLTGIIMMVGPAVWVPRAFLELLSLARAGGTVDLAAVNLQTWLLTAVAASFPMVIGLLLIYFPATVANRVIARDTDAAGRHAGVHGDVGQDLRHLEEVGFSILGLYFVATAMFDAVYWCAKLRLYPALFDEPYVRRVMLDREFAGIVATGAQFVAGLALLLSGRGVAGIVRRLRGPLVTADTPAPASEAAAGETVGEVGMS
jgi:hypothetical protein